MNQEVEDIRGSTRILVGLIFFLGTAVEMFINYDKYEFTDWIIGLAIIGFGAALAVWGGLTLERSLKND